MRSREAGQIATTLANKRKEAKQRERKEAWMGNNDRGKEGLRGRDAERRSPSVEETYNILGN